MGNPFLKDTDEFWRYLPLIQLVELKQKQISCKCLNQFQMLGLRWVFSVQLVMNYKSKDKWLPKFYGVKTLICESWFQGMHIQL